MRAVLGWLRRRAQLEDVADGRGGAVAVIQRFGGALNLNVHIHALVLDGVFAKDRAGPLVFHPTSNLTALDVAEVLATVAPGIARLLNRRGIGEDADSAGEADAWTDEAPVLAGLAAASVQGRVALGRQRGARLRRLGVAPDEVTPRALGRCHARSHGCDLHAGLVVPAGQRERLERVCRLFRTSRTMPFSKDVYTAPPTVNRAAIVRTLSFPCQERRVSSDVPPHVQSRIASESDATFAISVRPT